jgi:hypothetical protein
LFYCLIKAVYKDGTFEIINIERGDTGSYKCKAMYRSYIFESKAGYVNVISSLPSENNINNNINNKRNQINLPIFQYWPEDMTAQINQGVIFDCMVEESSIYITLANNSNQQVSQMFTYKWLKDGVALDVHSSQNLELIQGNSLEIKNIKEQDAGTYTCRICGSLYHQNYVDQKFNSNHQEHREECDERSGVLKVLVSPRFIKQPKNINATLRTDVLLECSAYGVPQPEIQWFKNGEPMYASEYFQFNSKQGDLKILGIIGQDEGYYQCEASNELDTIQSIAQLTVFADKQDEEEYATDIVDYDDYNDYDANLKDSNFNTNLLQESKIFNSKTTSSSLMHEKVKSIVHLSAPNSLVAKEINSRSLQVEWKEPSIVRDNNKIGSKSKLIYFVSWKAKNTDRKREMNTSSTYFLIDELSPDTVYLINVCAFLANTKGPYTFIEAKTTNEETKSTLPLNFRVKFESNKKIVTKTDSKFDNSQMALPTYRFKWERPIYNYDRIVKYRLIYTHLHYGEKKPADDETSTTIKNTINNSSKINSTKNNIKDNSYDDMFDYTDFLADDIYSDIYSDGKTVDEEFIDIFSIKNETKYSYDILLDDLFKYSTYKFTLVAINHNASNEIKIDKDNSVSIIIETASDIPDGPPTNVKVATINTTTLLISWDEPSIANRNGLIIGYKISVQENEKRAWNLNVDSEPRRKYIENLYPGKKYSIRLTARTVNGSGPSSDWFIAETFENEMDESKVPGSIQKLHVEPTDKSIVLHWIPPYDSNTTLIRKYILKYGIGYPDKTVEIQPNHNSYILKQLVPSSQYVLSLRASNNMGYGMEILKDVITKRKVAVGENEMIFPPLNVHSVAISSHSIEVKWTDWHLKPDETIPDARFYTVRYKIADDKNFKFKFTTSKEREIILNGLRPNTLYDLGVRLEIGNRHSDWSLTSSQMTLEQSPAPRDITIKSDPQNPKNVILSWLPPITITTAPKVSPASTTDYVIYYLEEHLFKLNRKNKWRREYINSNINEEDRLMAIIRNLKLKTKYYFKIRGHVNRAYGASSPIISFQLPDEHGNGGGIISMSVDSMKPVELILNRDKTKIANKASNLFEMSIMWIITGGITLIIMFVLIIMSAAFIFKRKNKNKHNNNRNIIDNASLTSSKNNKLYNNSSFQRNGSLSDGYHSHLNESNVNSRLFVKKTIDEMNDDEDEIDSEYQRNRIYAIQQQHYIQQQQQQQQLLICTGGSSTTNNNNNTSFSDHLSCSGQSTINQHLNNKPHPHRTPIHSNLIVNNRQLNVHQIHNGLLI